MIEIKEEDAGILKDLANKASNDAQEAIMRTAMLVEGPNAFAIQMAATVNVVDITAGVLANLTFGGDEEKALEEVFGTIRAVLAMRRQKQAAKMAQN